MKKIICLIVVALMVASVAFAAAKAKRITAQDLPSLKGIWVGSLEFGDMGAQLGNSACTLEILNDTVPVKGKLTVSNVPDPVAQYLGLTAGKNEFGLDDGQITSQGTIVWMTSEKNMFEVSM